MSTDDKKGLARNKRVSRRVECLKSEPDIHAEASPIDRNDHDPADDSSAKKRKKFDTSAGFNPYDTGALYEE